MKYKHGMRKHKFFKLWSAIRQRCSNEKNSSYKNYGAKGIKVCKRWENFMNFKEDMFLSYIKHINKHGQKQTTIERIDSDKNYCKKNCKWATRFEQNRNTNRNVYIKFNGENKTISEWARKLNLHRSTIYKRIFKYNWSLEKALNK